jgi:hypothetical protein
VRVAYVREHPAQYDAPLMRLLAKQVDLRVFYESLAGAERFHDPEFGVAIRWDIDLLDGYEWTVTHPWELPWRLRGFDAIIVHGYTKPLHWCAFLGGWLWCKRVFFRGEVTRPTWLLRWIARRLTGVMAIGSLSRNVYKEMGIPDVKTFWVPYSVENERFSR